MPPEDKSRIDELNKSLYSRSAPDVRTRRRLRYGSMETEVKTGWERPPKPPEEAISEEKHKDHSMSFLVRLFIGSIIFCIAAVGIGAYLFLNGSNLISADNIDITISGPVSIPGGTPVSFDILVTNKNSVDLHSVDMAVNFPAGATDPSNPSQELSAYREILGDIKAGGSVAKTVQAVVFGEQNTQKTLTVGITYQVKGSSSPFTKEKTYDILINSSPVNLTVSSFKEITSGQEFDLLMDVKSNSSDTLKNVLLAATYPFGFTYLSSSLNPLPDSATWRLGDLPPGAERKITVHGKLEGENQDTRVFRVSVGAQSARNQNVIGTEFMSATQEIALKKSFMTMAISVNNDQSAADAAGSFNQPARVEISWFNNLQNAVSDAEVSVKLSGSAYDRTLVQPASGYFRSSTDEIFWNSQTTPQLAAVGAGESGSVSFSITPRDLSAPGRPVTNPELSFAVSVKGKRTQESGVPEALSSIVTRNEKISSSISLSGTVARSLGPFQNTGPIPPRVDQQTTYTIVWSVDNTTNQVEGVRVAAVLPPYVKWIGASPSSGDISYDSKTGTVSWNAGTVGTFTALNGKRKTVYFQISFEPNVNQAGTVPTLVGDATLTGTDDFTGVALKSVQNYLTTRFSTDPAYKAGNETVMP